MPADAQKCANCGAEPFVPKVEDGSCSKCGVDPFLVEVVGQKRALADALASQSTDVHKFVGDLAAMLEAGFGEHTQIKKSGLFTKHISEITVTLNQHVYRLEVHGKHAKGFRSRNSRGIKLKEDSLAMPEFLKELSDDLSAVAAESQQAKDALARFTR